MIIEKEVNKLAKSFGTRNPFELAGFQDVKVYSLPMGKWTKGFSLFLSAAKIIFINSELTDFESKVVCAHLLGHAILHSGHQDTFLEFGTLFKADMHEREANEFLVYLLLYDSIITEYSVMTPEQISTETGIPLGYINLVYEKAKKMRTA